ncbi:protein-disulfide reductase DsbD [Acinetobacter sp. ANC 4635]|uniref:protein-disulfide reductase DsbD n=1 Tax=Acinetobacter sp. ANC 4635 TaxID=2529846 RepID=UPI00103AE040|nr:protein-disulfide reductase DsbD [Acinetobacter sp. ANC 4635]TCB29494.1 protein-disulfide reductase DsbD [Acinetobacter sp. ANC 4635]
MRLHVKKTAILWLALQYCLLLIVSFPVFSHADELLPAEQAFQFSAESLSDHQAKLSWKIQPHYYLYQQKFTVQQGQQQLALKFPQAVSQHDDNFGQSRVYFNQVSFSIPTQPNQSYQVTWQGCAKDRLCYPPQKITIRTDADGLISMQDQVHTQSSLLELSQQQSTSLDSNTLNTTAAVVETKNAHPPTTVLTADDEVWSQRLSQHSFVYGLLLFLGLGILLAFTPCSLPMIPILTSLLIREHKGLKAWSIALVFVCSMASVYAVLGVVASSFGLSFQRWLQQPSILMAFSLLFVVFALNLFGLFEIKLPQTWTHRLDRAQSMQTGGSLLGASVMGVISALLVGPCMTAPLAGALLFISQTQNPWHGAVLLFSLGMGMGVPMLLVSLLGSRALPKAGLWMMQVKVVFAFIMLGLALYFIRPVLNSSVWQLLNVLLLVSFIAYLLYGTVKHVRGLKWLYAALLLSLVPAYAYQQYQWWQGENTVGISTQAQWHVAKTAAEFQALLAQAPQGQAIVVDVYADWCVACLPIEHQILPQPQVENALAPFYLIKLNLSQYDASHQALLSQWDILGPPTYLFLDTQHQEQRSLRLTGEFKMAALLQRLQQLAQKTQ